MFAWHRRKSMRAVLFLRMSKSQCKHAIHWYCLRLVALVTLTQDDPQDIPIPKPGISSCWKRFSVTCKFLILTTSGDAGSTGDTGKPKKPTVSWHVLKTWNSSETVIQTLMTLHSGNSTRDLNWRHPNPKFETKLAMDQHIIGIHWPWTTQKEP